MCQSPRTGSQHKGSGGSRQRTTDSRLKPDVSGDVLLLQLSLLNMNLSVYSLISFCRLDFFIGICHLSGFLRKCFQVTSVIGSYRYPSVFYYTENSCLFLEQVVN